MAKFKVNGKVVDIEVDGMTPLRPRIVPVSMFVG